MRRAGRTELFPDVVELSPSGSSMQTAGTAPDLFCRRDSRSMFSGRKTDGAE